MSEQTKVQEAIERVAIQKRIAELEKERDQFVQQANAQVAGYNGAINELKRLLEAEKAAD